MNEVAIRQGYELPTTFEDLSRFVLVGREKLVAVRAEIRAIEKVGLAQAVREQKLKEAQAISEAVLDAEVRIGQLMQSVVKASGGNHGNQYTNGKTDSGVDFGKTETTAPEKDKIPLILSKPKTSVIREAGFTPKQVERFQQLALHPEIVEQAKQEARENDDIVSRSLVLNMIKNEKRKAELQQQIEEIEQKPLIQPEGLFNVIVIDPPWAYGTGYDAAGRRCANPYPEMTQEQLKALVLPADDDCVLFLWTTHKFLWDAKDLMDTWGFTYRNMLVWDKQVMGMGNLFRMRCEFCLVGIKGRPIFKDVHNLEDIISEQRREHSRKPEAFYEMVNSLCTGRKLDYFSRTQRDGWEVFGNDTGKFNVA